METRSKKMRNVAAVAICLAGVVAFTACNKDKTSKTVLNLTGINDSKSEIVNVKLKTQKSVEKQAFSIDCYYLGTITFNAKSKFIGYRDCHNVYRIMDIETSREIKRIPSFNFNMVVLDTIRNVLIGHYAIQTGSGMFDYTDHVVTVNLNDGSFISDNSFYFSAMWGSTHFFRDIENEYVLHRVSTGVPGSADIKELVFINPSTGQIIRTLNLENRVSDGIYDRKNNRLIGTNLEENGKIYIVTVDLTTGKTLSKVIPQGLTCYSGDKTDYDAETNSYVLVNGNNEVVFFDVATGKVNEKYQLDVNLTSIQLWRSEK